MRILYLSPGFPPGSDRFCRAVKARGGAVAGIGDVHASDLPTGLLPALEEYGFTTEMHRDEALFALVAELTQRHGPFDRVESNGEHWLETEGRIRDRFGIAGSGAEEVSRLRSKLAMAETFRSAGVPCPDGIGCESEALVREFARVHGYPLVFKPDSGSGAMDTFRVTSDGELDVALRRPLAGHVVQPFVEGRIVTFDGLLDRSGVLVFCTAHAYDHGIMQVRNGALDGHYYSLRAIPPALEAVGRRAIRAFNLRERFFHLEFFAREDGSYIALELNVRPPGGFTTDMMGYAADTDVYDLWASVVLGDPLGDFEYRPKYFTAHAGRRAERAYFWSDAALRRELGDTIVEVREVPKAFAATMGDTAYILRTEDLDALQRAIRQVQLPVGRLGVAGN